LAFANENRRLALPDDELRSVFDFVLVPGEPVRKDLVLARFGPFDDVDELTANPVAQSHDEPPEVSILDRLRLLWQVDEPPGNRISRMKRDSPPLGSLFAESAESFRRRIF
jgi:hypothetical protein